MVVVDSVQAPVEPSTSSPTMTKTAKRTLTIAGLNQEGSNVPLPPVVKSFVEEVVALTKPSQIHVCDGSDAESDLFMERLVAAGTARKLNQEKRPGCYATFTHPDDTARSVRDTFICSKTKREAGPTNNHVDPVVKMKEMKTLFNGSMTGRIAYVIPFLMGPADKEELGLAKVGVQVTDSAYVAASMKIMARMGQLALDSIANEKCEFVRCVHSMGCPLTEDNPNSEEYKRARSTWPCNLKHRNICHFPDSREIWSFGSGYGGNSITCKKSFALRIASIQGRDEGWLAEHMLILGITNPNGEKKYIAAAFPSACGKTNLAMLEPTLPGWKVETVGDDIAWMKPGADGKLYAINPENGFFGVAPGTSMTTNPNAMGTIAKNTVFTNVAITEDNDVYWEGMDRPEGSMTNWLGEHIPADSVIDEKKNPAAHPNSRFATPLAQCPVLDPNWNNPQGVPIDAIIFGGRRDDTLPLILEAFSWQHGTFLGATMRSKATKASEITGLVHDPMAIKAFCGYNIKDYFQHWLTLGNADGAKMPKIFHVNWFLKNDQGKFIWPGFGENIRVLKWIFERVDGQADAVETPIGLMPPTGDGLRGLDLSGLDSITPEDVSKVLHVDRDLWLQEALHNKNEYFGKSLVNEEHPSPMPAALNDEVEQLLERLNQ